MSDLSTAKEKLKAGAEWRGTITVELDGDELELTVRQLRDPEFEEVMGHIDRDELQALKDEYPSDEMDELRDLQSADDLSDDEADRLAELEDEMADVDVNIFDILSDDTFGGIRKAAIYGVEPDEEDLEAAFRERARDIEAERGIKVKTPEDVRPVLQDEWEDRVRNATDFASFRIGMEVLTETVGDEGNSSN